MRKNKEPGLVKKINDKKTKQNFSNRIKPSGKEYQGLLLLSRVHPMDLGTEPFRIKVLDE